MADEKKEVAENFVLELEALPKAIMRRVVKEKLSQISADYDISVLRDSLQAFSESARIFIHYLSATANDICKESKRQIMNAEDVFKALEEIQFLEFIEPLRDFLEEFRQRNARKKKDAAERKSATPSKDASVKPIHSKAKDVNRKAKRKEPPSKDGDESLDRSRKKQHAVESDGDDKSD